MKLKFHVRFCRRAAPARGGLASATADRSRRFDDLFNLVVDPAWRHL